MAAESYLTPYDELIETSQLGERRMQAANALNPLYQRDQALLAEVAGVPAPPTPQTQTVSAQPNLLIQPPAPLSTMPIDKQMAWQQYNAQATKAQADIDSTILNQQIARQKAEHEAELLRQGKSLIARTGELDPNDLKNYPLQRAKLAREHPLFAMSEDGKRALEHYDATYAGVLNLETQYKKAEEAARRGEDTTRRQVAFKEASDQGADALARFLELEKTNPEAAITTAMQGGAKVRQQNIEAILQSGGMTPEDIAQKYQRDGTFLFGAAEAEAKQRITPQQEVRNLRDFITMEQKRREDANYRGKPNTKWPQEDEDNLNRAREEYNTLQNRGKRAGVQISPGAMQVSQQQAFNYATTPGLQPQVPQVVTRPQQQLAPIAAGQPQPAPKPTPAPPPLNPQYPEQWRGGKRYIQQPDGKWYLSKVQ